MGEIFGDLYGGEKDSVLSLDTRMCSYENLKVLSWLFFILIAQMKTVFEDKVDFLDGFIKKCMLEQCERVHSVCRPVR